MQAELKKLGKDFSGERPRLDVVLLLDMVQPTCHAGTTNCTCCSCCMFLCDMVWSLADAYLLAPTSVSSRAPAAQALPAA